MLPSKFRISRIVRRLVGNFLDFLTRVETLSLDQTGPKSKVKISNKASYDGDRVLIYACYCSEPKQLQERIKEALSVFDEFDEIIIVNSGTAEIESLEKKGLEIVSRPNSSRDLGAYKEILFLLKKSNLSELVLINDSVFWLQDGLLNFVRGAHQSDYRITGLCESRQGSYHIQSFAMHFKEPSPEILAPILRVGNWKMKRTLVFQGEKYFSKIWAKQKINFGALYSTSTLQLKSLEYLDLYGRDKVTIHKLFSDGVDLNPSIHYWPGLLAQARIIKKSLIRDNPAKFSDSPKSIQEAELILAQLLGNAKG